MLWHFSIDGPAGKPVSVQDELKTISRWQETRPFFGNVNSNDRHSTDWELFERQRVILLQGNARTKRQVLTLEGRSGGTTVICRVDVELEVRWGKAGGGGDRVLSRRLADTCGTKLSANRVNESWRASEAAGWFVFQYYPSLSLVREWRRRRGQRVASQNHRKERSEGSPAAELSGQVSVGSGWTCHRELSLISLYLAFHAGLS